jgi:type I restriction enzyme S subunit
MAATVPLGELAERITSGSRSWRSRLGSGSGRFLLAQCVRDGALDLNAAPAISAPADKEAERTRVRLGDVLITVVGDVGRVALVRDDPGEAYVSQSVALVRPNGGINPRYLETYLRSPRHGQAYFEEMQYGVGRGHLLLSHLRDLPVVLPPLQDQSRIVEAVELQLSRADVAVASIRRAVRNIQRYKTGLLQQAVAGKLTAGTGWRMVALGDVLLSLRNGLSQKPTGTTGTRILRISAVRPLRVDLSDVRFLSPQVEVEAYLLRENDLLFTRYNGNTEFVGVCGRVRGLAQPTAHPDKLIRGVVDELVALPAFVELAANAGITREFIRSRTKTTAGQAGIAGADLKAAPLLLPSLDEQGEVVAIIEAKLSIADKLAQTLSSTERQESGLRRRILDHSFVGRHLGQIA